LTKNHRNNKCEISKYTTLYAEDETCSLSLPGIAAHCKVLLGGRKLYQKMKPLHITIWNGCKVQGLIWTEKRIRGHHHVHALLVY